MLDYRALYVSYRLPSIILIDYRLGIIRFLPFAAFKVEGKVLLILQSTGNMGIGVAEPTATMTATRFARLAVDDIAKATFSAAKLAMAWQI